MKLTVLCCTFDRPRLLEHVLWCFHEQTHADRQLIVLDDSGRLGPQSGDRWRIRPVESRFDTLGRKRNFAAELASDDADGLVVWDDDDLYMPWALEATAAALERGPWSRPSVACVAGDKELFRRVRTYHRPDRSDAAFQCCWGIRPKAFWSVGGYPADLSRAEDCHLAWRLWQAGIEEADPIALGYDPFYLWGPWPNPHLTHLPYEQWPAPASAACPLPPPVVLPRPPEIDGELARPAFSRRVHARPGPRDWFAQAGLP